MTLYFLKGSSGYIKIGRTSNFDKPLSEIRRATTDEHVEVLAVFHGDDDFVIATERDLHFRLTEHRFKGEWYFSTPAVFEALADTDAHLIRNIIRFQLKFAYKKKDRRERPSL
jgi:hypothetical protein